MAVIANVSISTVSRALTGKGSLNQATRDRIRALADEHGFQLNVSAQNLRLGRTGAIAVLLPLGHERGQQLSDPFFSSMLGHIADALTGHGYDLLLSRVLPDRPDWLDVFVRSGRADGAIVIGQSDQGAVLSQTATHYDRLVVWGNPNPANGYVTIGSDNVTGGAIAARHLMARGRQNLAFFGASTAPEFTARQQGFLDTLPDDIRSRTKIVPIPFTPEASFAVASQFFALGNRPDGIFCASDVIAMSVLSAAADAGIKVPQDLAVVGFDDILLSRIASPPLTTVRQDIEGGAHRLVDSLMRKLAGEQVESHCASPALVVREST
nr:substrate-binding domain-containing protein [Novosphingobium sp. FKTRR1]